MARHPGGDGRGFHRLGPRARTGDHAAGARRLRTADVLLPAPGRGTGHRAVVNRTATGARAWGSWLDLRDGDGGGTGRSVIPAAIHSSRRRADAGRDRRVMRTSWLSI